MTILIAVAAIGTTQEIAHHIIIIVVGLESRELQIIFEQCHRDLLLA
jgi:hypothetical protein